MQSFKIFYGISFFEHERTKYDQIYNEIRSRTDEYILQVDEDKYIEYLVEKYRYELLTFYFDKESIEENNNTITYYLPFDGDKELLEFRPNPCRMWTRRIFLKNNCVCFNIDYTTDSRQMYNEIEKVKNNIQNQYNNLEKEVNDYNSSLRPRITTYFKSYKERIIEKNNTIASIGIPLRRKNDAQTYAVSTPEKKKILHLEPKVIENTMLEPTVSQEDYNFILKLIYDGGKVFERLPSTSSNKDEETLRDHLIFILTPHFEGSVTGETFNKSGKTDILLRYKNTNVFVAECKFWRGIKSYYAAIDQLLSYLTWRDSKTALILFVDNKEINPVIEQINNKTENHENFIRKNKPTSESWLNYTFHLNDDKSREIKLAVLIFHIKK
ncbi:hypothetical protein [Methanobrevibacter sp.]|uniref:hypothetical protein n=1 Tax=Methanobrevibacter sp. TaxID=66852 RepID=UPI00386D8223